jgi:hypothetical protein
LHEFCVSDSPLVIEVTQFQVQIKNLFCLEQLSPPCRCHSLLFSVVSLLLGGGCCCCCCCCSIADNYKDTQSRLKKCMKALRVTNSGSPAVVCCILPPNPLFHSIAGESPCSFGTKIETTCTCTVVLQYSTHRYKYS